MNPTQRNPKSILWEAHVSKAQTSTNGLQNDPFQKGSCLSMRIGNSKFEKAITYNAWKIWLSHKLISMQPNHQIKELFVWKDLT